MLWKMRLNVCKELAARRTEPDLSCLERSSLFLFQPPFALTDFALQWENFWLSAAGRHAAEVKTYLRWREGRALSRHFRLETLTVVTDHFVEYWIYCVVMNMSCDREKQKGC